MHRNRLADETSPYLLQHAANPVDWYPWGPEALAAARQQNKPILLSIGYSACHWCHVMAHESFEDAATAELMNRLFVNIKVDREERPDLDRIYQIAQQLLTQSPGGWPLTMFLSPHHQTPFFGGTFFGKTARGGLPAFSDILTRVAAYFSDHQARIDAQNTQLAAAFERLQTPAPPPGLTLDAAPLETARAVLEQAFDADYGGFGGSPKFPPASSITRCLRHWYGTAHAAGPDLKALYMASLTLTRMAEGGFYDQLGGGFARYSVDAYWMIPHFEKMLYDNGQLLFEYAAAAGATGDELFAKIAGETADWLLRDMHSHEGGFYSSLDADSEGHEGRFYVWTRAELEERLTREEYNAFAARFAVDGPPNFEDRWHLRVHRDVDDIATQAGVSATAIQALLDSARAKLLAVRNLRIWPARDEKILTAWNGLAIKGLAHAARVLNRPDLAQAATAAVDFIQRSLWRDGRLLAAYKDGRAHLAAYLDDHAFLLDALLELLQTRWRSSDLHFAVALAEVLLGRFEDPAGAFYFTASDHEQLFHRSKSFSDDSTAAGSAIAAAALTRLGYLLSENRYLAAAERTLAAAWPLLLDYPRGHMSMLNALDDFLTTQTVVIIRGPVEAVQAWARQLQAVYAPLRLTFAIPHDAEHLPRALADKPPPTPGAPGAPQCAAYVCRGSTCSAPLGDLPSVVRLLNAADARGARSRA